MRQLLLNKKILCTSILTITMGMFAGTSQAQINITNSSLERGQGRIVSGGASSLDNAKAIMYGSNIRNATPSSSYNNRHQSYNSHYNSNSYNNHNTHYNGYHNSNTYNHYSNESSSDTAKVFQKYSHNYYEGNSYGSAGSASTDNLGIHTGSRGVMVVDAISGEPLYQKNADIPRPIASITKVMTAMVLLDGGQDLNEQLTVRSSDRRARLQTNYYKLNSGDRLSRGQMLLMALMVSDNASAKALARNYPGGTSAFLAAMNRKAQSLGMYSAKFYDPSGLDERNVASPADLVKMFRAASNYPLIRQYSTTPYHNFHIANARGGREYTGRSTNTLVKGGYYPITMQKTGYIKKAGKCVVMEAQYNNRPAIVVLLGAGSSSTRWNDAKTILDNLSFRRYI